MEKEEENEVRGQHFIINNVNQMMGTLTTANQEIIPNEQEKHEWDGSRGWTSQQQQVQLQCHAKLQHLRDLIVINGTENNYLKNNLLNHKEENSNLQVGLEDLESTITEQQVRLKATVEEIAEVIRTLKLKLTEVKQTMESLHFQTEETESCGEKYMQLMKKGKKYCIKKKKKLQPEIVELISHKLVLREKLDQSKITINAHKDQRKQLRLHRQDMITCKRRFDEEVEAYLSEQTKPELLEEKLAVLQGHKTDNTKVKHIPGNLEAEYQTEITNREKRLECVAQTVRTRKTLRRQEKDKLSEIISTVGKKDEEYTELLRVEKCKRRQKERELKKANVKVGHDFMAMMEISAIRAFSLVNPQIEEDMVALWPIRSDLSDTETETLRHICDASCDDSQ